MLLRKFFPSLYTAPDTAPAVSTNAVLYLMRGVFYMGIRTPPERYFWIYCLWSFVLNGFSTFYQPIGFYLGCISQLSDTTPADLLTSLQVTFNLTSCSTKVVIVWLMIKRFDIANQMLDEMDKRLTRPIERRRVHQAVALSNAIFATLVFVCFTYAISTFIASTAFGKPPYNNYFPGLNWQESTWKFWLQSLLDTLPMVGSCLQDGAVDSYPSCYMLVLRAHLINFADRMRELGRNPDESPEECYEQLIECIQDHKLIMRYCETFRPMISATVFMQLLVVGVVLGFTVINITMFANFGSSIAALFFVSAVLLETTPFCIICNYVMDDSLKLADALFECNWINQDTRFKKTLLQFLMTLQKPIVFRAANMFPISVATNITAIKFSFSVYTLVKQMNLAEKLDKLSIKAA